MSGTVSSFCSKSWNILQNRPRHGRCFSLPASAKSLYQNAVVPPKCLAPSLFLLKVLEYTSKGVTCFLCFSLPGSAKTLDQNILTPRAMSGAISLFAQNLGIHLKSCRRGGHVSLCLLLPTAVLKIVCHCAMSGVLSLSLSSLKKRLKACAEISRFVLFGGTFKIISITNILLNTHSNKTLTSFCCCVCQLQRQKSSPSQSCSASCLLSD